MIWVSLVVAWLLAVALILAFFMGASERRRR